MWLQRGAGTAVSLQDQPPASAGREETEAETQPWGAKGSFNQRGDTALLSSHFYRPRRLTRSSAAAVLVDPRFLLLIQPWHTGIADLIHSVRQPTVIREFSLPSFAFPIGLGSQAPTVQEGDKNRRAPRRLRCHYSETGSSGPLGSEGWCSW